MKLPTAGAVVALFGNQEEARRCEDNTSYATKNVDAIEASKTEGTSANLATPEEPQKAEGLSPAEHTKRVPLCEDILDRTVIIGKGLKEAEEARLIQFLRNNQDVFAWSSADLRGVNRDIMEYTLRVDPKVRPKRQRLRTMSDERKKAAQAKVQKLLDAGVIREV